MGELTSYEVTPVDDDATDETKALFTSLGKLRYDTKFLFGHQNDNYIGQYFKDKTGELGYSDVQNGTGSYPAVFGYDFADVVENGQSFQEHVKQAYSAGGVIAFDWKPCNPEKVLARKLVLPFFTRAHLSSQTLQSPCIPFSLPPREASFHPAQSTKPVSFLLL